VLHTHTFGNTGEGGVPRIPFTGRKGRRKEYVRGGVESERKRMILGSYCLQIQGEKKRVRKDSWYSKES